jgi:four helix bundle protein
MTQDAWFWIQDAGWADEMSGSYRELEVYQLAHAFAVAAHQFSLRLPKHELYETGNQLRRASKSVFANIVEGYGRRRYKQEFLRFLVYAQASCDETAEWLAYVRDCHGNLADENAKLLQQVEQVGRKLNKFIQAVENGHRSER